LAVQAHHAPAPAPRDEGGAQLVAEVETRHDVRVAGAAEPVPAGRPVERPHRVVAGRERHEPVDVGAVELIAQELGRDGVERGLGQSRGEQQRRRVDGGEEGGVDGEERAEAPEHFGAQRGGVEP